MFQDSPIYDRLIAECGDVPAQVRREAERVSRELELVMRPLQSPGYGTGFDRPHAPGNGWQRAALLPGPRPH
ncbi:hypothetical protein HTV80_25115 [Streptomyces sp. Vc74B-19]|uniref:hypothetical protein n=1 Tax=unclassified Streptomyces TaxID=2593676 RepID=UPI001BFCAA49|nr:MULTISPECIES: hypothetical protein [unclassified Streptomyces]MBT3166354.1 hypothetical protein [Streptomyces sp. Vc74B-19]MCO4698970.1 hypothetical protein [Streptomyces sp. RO-S4]MDU0302470.1 hypothetical protein [Streptomyces sp. PAL114]